MFNLASAFIPDENGNLVAIDTPLSQADLPPGDYGMQFVKMFLTMIALVALFGLSIWFLRRLVRNRLERGTGAHLIQVIEKKMISPKTMLYIVEIEGKKILFAESHLEIKKLQDIVDHKEIEQ